MYVRALDDVRSVCWRLAFLRRGRAIYEFRAFLRCLQIQSQWGKPYCPVRSCVRGLAMSLPTYLNGLNLNAIELPPAFNIGYLFDWLDLLGASVLYPIIYEMS